MAFFGLFGSSAPNVEKLNQQDDIPGLIKALGYRKDPQVRRDAASAQNFLPMVDVVKKGVDGPNPLFNAPFKALPFAPGNDTRHDIERDQAFFGFSLSIDVEGDAGQPEDFFSFAVFCPKP